jgi:hypothetical protein
MRFLSVLCFLVFSSFVLGKTVPISQGGKSSFAIGSASDVSFTGSEVPALTAIWSFSDLASIQFYLGIPSISPAFLMGGGANFRYSVAGDNSKGVHVGGGLGLGAKNFGGARAFFINIAPTVGVHFEIVDRVLVSVDSGVTFSLMPGGANNIDITLGGRSLLLGMSFVYIL